MQEGIYIDKVGKRVLRVFNNNTAWWCLDIAHAKSLNSDYIGWDFLEGVTIESTDIASLTKYKEIKNYPKQLLK